MSSSPQASTAGTTSSGGTDSNSMFFNGGDGKAAGSPALEKSCARKMLKKMTSIRKKWCISLGTIATLLAIVATSYGIYEKWFTNLPAGRPCPFGHKQCKSGSCIDGKCRCVYDDDCEKSFCFQAKDSKPTCISNEKLFSTLFITEMEEVTNFTDVEEICTVEIYNASKCYSDDPHCIRIHLDPTDLAKELKGLLKFEANATCSDLAKTVCPLLINPVNKGNCCKGEISSALQCVGKGMFNNIDEDCHLGHCIPDGSKCGYNDQCISMYCNKEGECGPEPTSMPAPMPIPPPTTRKPSEQPSLYPTPMTTPSPSSLPSGKPSLQPTTSPSRPPTPLPTIAPTANPTAFDICGEKTFNVGEEFCRIKGKNKPKVQKCSWFRAKDTKPKKSREEKKKSRRSKHCTKMNRGSLECEKCSGYPKTK